jgi:uncharacterized protein (DUF1330 family)
MPKGYFLSEVDVTNPTAYDAYRTRVLPTVEKFGGRFLEGRRFQSDRRRWLCQPHDHNRV